jgi:undecaprenyl-diphosphatase
VLLVAGVALGAAVSTGGLLPGDVAVARELQEQRPIDTVVLPVMVLVSAPGNDPWVELVFGAAVAVLAVGRHWAAAALLALTAVADLLAAAIKLAVARPRPTPDVVEIYRQVSGYSFPSGHVVHYVVFFGVIGYLAWRGRRTLAPSDRWGRLALDVVLGVCGVLIVLVGPSRVFLGAHWPTDVLGGYLLGGTCLLVLVAGYEWWTARATAPASAEGRLRSAVVDSATPTGDHPDARAG